MKVRYKTRDGQYGTMTHPEIAYEMQDNGDIMLQGGESELHLLREQVEELALDVVWFRLEDD